MQLLKAAGWQEGRGLGSAEQGRLEPVQAHFQHGKAGIGVPSARQASQPAPELCHRQASKAKHADSKGDSKTAEAQPGGKKRRGPQPVPKVEEDPTVKLKRVRQVWQAEVDDAAGKAIQAYIYSAFNDATGEAGPDNNPLLRRNKLTSSNPLL